MKIVLSHRVRLTALLVAVGATAFLFFGFPFVGEQVARLFGAWFDTLSSQQQHVVTNIGRIVSYAVPFIMGGMVALGIYLRGREGRSAGRASGEI